MKTRTETRAMLNRANALVGEHGFKPTSQIHRDTVRAFVKYNLGEYDEAYFLAWLVVKFLNGGKV